MRTLSATEQLFGGARPAETGAGVRVLLLDALPAQGGHRLAGERFRVLDERAREGSAAEQHAFRRASLLCEGTEAASHPGGALGAAPEVEVSVASDDLARGGDLSALPALVAEFGPFEIIGFCRGFEVEALGPRARATLAELAREALLLAAAHTGEVELGPDVLVVTRETREGWTSPCIAPAEAGADEVALLARAPDGSLGHLPLGEAGVPLVAGLAALWCQRALRGALELEPAWRGPALRALLLAGAAHARSAGTPLGAALLSTEPPLLQSGSIARLSLELTAAEGCAAVVHSDVPASPLWLSPLVQLPPHAEPASLERDVRAGDGWGSVRLVGGSSRAVALGVSEEALRPASRLTWAGFGVRGKSESARAKPRAAARPLTIVGISASHDASACLFRDGRLISAIQLERLTRHKHDGRAFLHARQAVDYCLASAGLRERDVDLFAFNCMPLAPTFTGLSVPSHDATFDLFDPFGERAVFVSHHLCHAFGAFYGCDFDAATVIVCDGSGGSTVGRSDLVLRGPELADYLASTPRGDERLHVLSAYHFTPAGWSLVEREHASSFNVLTGHGHLGEMYASASQYVFGDWQESGKLMGLAPYGDAERFGPSLLARGPTGRLEFTHHWKNQLRSVLERSDPMEHKDFAARIQSDLEQALLERVSRAIDLSGETRVAYAGGVALNSVANQRLRTETPMSALYVMPASHDAGICVGAAAAAHHLATGRLEPSGLRTDAFGHAYDRRDYAHALRQFRDVLRINPVSLSDVVERLAAHQVIGWFQGRSEFGPRALGQRSILASPATREMWTHINRRIKYREDFRPFAPMVPEEVASRYFELDEPSPFMLRVVKVREPFRGRLGAITHVDGSARVQTVSAQDLPVMHALLHAFGGRCGLPILVNTSLNVRGEPLVETPLEAVEMLLATHLDALVFEGELLLEPLAPAREGLLDTVIALPPKSHLESRSDRQGSSYALVAEARGHEQTRLPQWAFELLGAADGRRSVGELLERMSRPERNDEARQLISALLDLRLLLPSAPADWARAEPARPGPAEPVASAAECCTDPTPFLPGTQRTLSAAETIARVEPHLLALGISRVAELTEYDFLGIPVFSCIRPFVESDDITCTQGKGLEREDALASALMETVERFSGYHTDHLRTRISTPAELAKTGEPWLRVSTLGGVDHPDAPIEWVWAYAVRGAPRWVPASSVFAPYRAPAGLAAPLGWCTTGLSAGNTLHEAIAHGILEVIERDAFSRYVDGEPAQRLDLESVPAGPERELLSRLTRARCEMFVVDLSNLAGLPVFSLALFDPEGPEPRLPLAGQGAGLQAASALRRAALEAAQSRVVAIQGSREDLVRHGSQWLEDPAARMSHWRESKQSAARGGSSRFVEPSHLARPPATVGELLSALLERLEARGHGEVLYVDLTHPGIGIPVASVIIPGLYDSHNVPGIRRHAPRERS